MSTITPPRPSSARPAGAPPRPPQTGRSSFGANVDPIRVLRRYMLLFIAAAIVGTAIGIGAFLYLNFNHAMYAGQVLFEIQPGVRDSRDVAAGEITSDQLVARLAGTESALLTSRQVLRAAVRHPEVRQTRWAQQFIGEDGQTYLIEDAIDDLEESLNASIVRGTNFFRLRWMAATPADVPVVLNRVAQEYIRYRKSIDDQTWTANIGIFDSELRSITRDLDDLDDEIRNFIRDHGITSLSDPRFSQTSSHAQQLTYQIRRLTSTLRMTESALQQTAAKLDGVIEPTPDDIFNAKRDPLVYPLVRRLAELQSRQRYLLEKYNADHRTVRENELQIRTTEIERDAKVEEIIRETLEARYNALLSQVEQLRSVLNDVHAEAEAKDAMLRDLTAHMAHYQSMEARRARKEARRDSYQTIIQEVQLLRARDDAARVRMAEQAYEPRVKAFPKVHIVTPLGTLGLLAITVGLVFLRELTDQRIKSASDLAILPGARVMGVIPDLGEDPVKTKKAELVVREHPHSVLAESYRQACAVLTAAAERNAVQTIAVMSGLPGAGVTTAITNLSAALAATGKSVLVVDANFRRPKLAQMMGTSEDGPGLGDVLVGDSTTEDAIERTEYGVDVMRAGTPANRIIERLNNGMFETVIAELRGRYEMILFDTPPAVVAGEAMVVANRVDASLLVIRANQEQRGLVARLINQLADARCEHLGILLNRPRRTAGGYFKKNFEAMAKYSNG